ncbi:MAG TPA: putative quinol monooxygenase [Cyclobacteriaceae bacterium]|nr:putative quinol monooxygenase [Cyclobacteriaceae bacterium]
MRLILLIGAAAMFTFTLDSLAQEKSQMIRIAKIRIDSAQLENYKIAVKEQIEAAVRTEPGVLMLYAVYDKKDPTSVTVFEIYADEKAYQSHLQTAHFKKYKTGTQKMVKSFELIDVDPIALGAKER